MSDEYFVYILDRTETMFFFFFFSSRRRHTRCSRDWSSDVCSSDLWLPMTTVLLVSFRTDWLRREDTMKTAWKETGNRWAAVFSIRMDGAAGQNRTCSSTWGWKQEKFQRWGKGFLLTSPSIEHPPRPQKKRARIPRSEEHTSEL